MVTKKEFTDGWKHFCDCIDFNHSNLDAEAIQFMNEMPSKIFQAIKQRNDLRTALTVALLALTHKPIHPDDIAFIKQAIAKSEK